MKNFTVKSIQGKWTFFYKEGLLHKEGEPAIEYCGTKVWYKEGKLHREDGPAIDYANGDKDYFYNGKEINCETTEEFIRLIKLREFW